MFTRTDSTKASFAPSHALFDCRRVHAALVDALDLKGERRALAVENERGVPRGDIRDRFLRGGTLPDGAGPHAALERAREKIVFRPGAKQ